MTPRTEAAVVWFVRVTVVGLLVLGHLLVSPDADAASGARFTSSVLLDTSQVVGVGR